MRVAELPPVETNEQLALVDYEPIPRYELLDTDGEPVARSRGYLTGIGVTFILPHNERIEFIVNAVRFEGDDVELYRFDKVRLYGGDTLHVKAELIP